jgi:hypothetical protein
MSIKPTNMKGVVLPGNSTVEFREFAVEAATRSFLEDMGMVED